MPMRRAVRSTLAFVFGLTMLRPVIDNWDNIAGTIRVVVRRMRGRR